MSARLTGEVRSAGAILMLFGAIRKRITLFAFGPFVPSPPAGPKVASLCEWRSRLLRLARKASVCLGRSNHIAHSRTEPEWSSRQSLWIARPHKRKQGRCHACKLPRAQAERVRPRKAESCRNTRLHLFASRKAAESGDLPI